MDRLHKIKADVITMDVEMPGLSGIDFLKELLPKHPIPVILVSSLNLSVFDIILFDMWPASDTCKAYFPYSNSLNGQSADILPDW